MSAGDEPVAIDGEQVVGDVSDEAEDEQADYHAIAAE